MPKCVEVSAWRLASKEELIAFTEGKIKPRGSEGGCLVVRSRLSQVDMYSYLRARFGIPNGFQNFLRKDDSDNLVHWDFNVMAGEVHIYILARMRDVVIMVGEPMTDEDWKSLILALKMDFGRIGLAKSKILQSFEKFVVFQNKFAVLANLCADLHASIIDSPEVIRKLPRVSEEANIDELKSTIESIAKRATDLYGDCLKLRLLTPIMAEAFLNMLILTFCKDEVRNDKARYNAFLRDIIPERLAKLSVNCVGFERDVDPKSNTYRDFLRVINRRNFALHGSVDPIREQIETVYFEGKRPLFADNGDHLLKLFEHLERIYAPQEVARDYEATHLFLAEVLDLLSPRYRSFFEHVIDDPYPGYEVKTKRVTKILPSYNGAMLVPGERYDDDLQVTWGLEGG